jgi:YegS/Rv2252/BmrU family lipid kinase
MDSPSARVRGPHIADAACAGSLGWVGARRRVVAIVNPATHGDAARIVALLRGRVPAGVDLEVCLTRSAGTTTTLAREVLAAGASAAVAVGGDGTVAAVAAALQGTGIPLGIIPGGSTNITARSLGIPADPAAAVALLFGPHRTVPLDIGLCGDACFLHMAGAGLDSRLFADAAPALKRRVGWLAYVPPALHGLTLPPSRFTIVADGVTSEVVSSMVLVCNGSTIISPNLSLYPGVRTDDGQLDVLVLTADDPWELVRTLASLAAQDLEFSPYVTHLRARHIVITADPVLPVELDGDVVRNTPLEVTLVPAALRVIVSRREEPSA